MLSAYNLPSWQASKGPPDFGKITIKVGPFSAADVRPCHGPLFPARAKLAPPSTRTRKKAARRARNKGTVTLNMGTGRRLRRATLDVRKR